MKRYWLTSATLALLVGPVSCSSADEGTPAGSPPTLPALPAATLGAPASPVTGDALSPERPVPVGQPAEISGAETAQTSAEPAALTPTPAEAEPPPLSGVEPSEQVSPPSDRGAAPDPAKMHVAAPPVGVEPRVTPESAPEPVVNPTAEPVGAPTPEPILDPTVEPPAPEQEPEPLPGAPVPTLLALRGDLVLDDDGTTDHSGRNLGRWVRSPEDSMVWRVTHSGTGHPPVGGYGSFPEHENLIIEITVRWGELMGGNNDEAFVRIASDFRPGRGHIVSAWANSKGRYTKTGLVLENSERSGNQVLDEQPFGDFLANKWYTAVLEVVGNEALFHFDGRVAYTDNPMVGKTRNRFSITLGTTWHEVQRVRFWTASPNPDWAAMKDAVLEGRVPFTERPR